MEYSNITIEVRNGIIHLTINRPKALNALNTHTIEELGDFFTSGYQQFTFSGIIITGAGEKSFVAGADISEFRNLTPESGAAFSRRGQEVFFLIERFHKPVIAAVNGFALGGGCELAMACHLRIASSNARFGQPEVNLGTIPGYGGTQRLLQYIGKTKAMELMLTGDMLSAQEAHQLGLVNRVVEQNELLAACEDILGKIAAKGPIAVREVIACVNAYYETGENGFKTEFQGFGIAAGSEDFKEGAAAFLEKRKPEFKGK